MKLASDVFTTALPLLSVICLLACSDYYYYVLEVISDVYYFICPFFLWLNPNSFSSLSGFLLKVNIFNLSNNTKYPVYD